MEELQLVGEAKLAQCQTETAVKQHGNLVTRKTLLSKQHEEDRQEKRSLLLFLFVLCRKHVLTLLFLFATAHHADFLCFCLLSRKSPGQWCTAAA